MILLVDAGNTRLKWAWLTPKGMEEGGACPARDATALAAAWAHLSPGRAIVSVVSGESVKAAILAQPALRGVPVHWLISQARAHGLINAYQPPESLGSDRYAALIAARRRFDGPCLVVGAGTAITADMLDEKGVFLGGCIAPGLTLMRESLALGTAGVGRQDAPCSDAPLDTASAVGTGVQLAVLGVISGMRARLGRHAGIPPGRAAPQVILTGGSGSGLLPFVEAPAVVAEGLVLEGLAWVARDLGYVD